MPKPTNPVEELRIVLEAAAYFAECDRSIMMDLLQDALTLVQTIEENNHVPCNIH
jgi:hypothetical protein